MHVLIGSRLLYNQCLEELIEHYRSTGKHLNLYAQDKLHGKEQHPDLPAVIVDTTLKRLHLSFANFFRRCKEGAKEKGFPRFKSGNRWHSFRFRDAGPQLKGSYFHAPKLCGGKIRVNVHRPLEGSFKFARIIKRPSGWYLQCVCETQPQPLPALDNAVGLDMGITSLVADSDGVITPNPQHLKASLKQLAKAQRVLSRRKKGSRRRRKQGRLVARIHERIGNQRKDTLHKVARHYVNSYQTIVVEDLQPCNMVKNHHLARAIMDSSWGLLRQLLADKAEKAGRVFVAVPPHYTSQKCSKCGEYVQKSLSVRTHVCPHCGYVADRDVNAAKNILKLIGSDGAFGERQRVALNREATPL